MRIPLTDGRYLLRKFPGKGGWTYIEVPEINPDPHAHFGWVLVCGSIDHYPISQCRLMPMGNGRLFLPVKAALRKELGKGAGDEVHLVLYPDVLRVEVPEELYACLQDEPEARLRFDALSPGNRKEYIDWIYSARRAETRAQRIGITINQLLQGIPFREKRSEW